MSACPIVTAIQTERSKRDGTFNPEGLAHRIRSADVRLQIRSRATLNMKMASISEDSSVESASTTMYPDKNASSSVQDDDDDEEEVDKVRILRIFVQRGL